MGREYIYGVVALRAQRTATHLQMAHYNQILITKY